MDTSIRSDQLRFLQELPIPDAVATPPVFPTAWPSS
jgi:hypothetical protein